MRIIAGFATVGSDLDIVLVDKSVGKDQPYFEIPLLIEIELKNHGLEAQLLSKTRVPILKIKQPASEEWPRELAADIGFANSLAIRNTEMLSVYSKCDPRVREIVRFVKVRIDICLCFGDDHTKAEFRAGQKNEKSIPHIRAPYQGKKQVHKYYKSFTNLICKQLWICVDDSSLPDEHC